VNRNSKQDILNFYKEQLSRFKKIGLGNQTEFGTVITDTLINATKRRYFELSSRQLEYNKEGLKGWSCNGTI
tara:strand:+ start:624 stop:839 length:216 start_codon:yes stop_codon:yes gene_type:complete